MKLLKMRLAGTVIGLGAALAAGRIAGAENCITQSQMQPEERTALAETARSLALKVQANDQAGLQAGTIAEFAGNFSGIGQTVTATAPKLAGDTAAVEQIYVLDASANKKNADGSSPDADFVCTLTTAAKTPAEADFTIPGLPPGKYAFAMVEFSGASPWSVSMLLRQDSGVWKLAGLFPRETAAAGHDGLWYWSHARAMANNKQPWVAYIYYQEAQQLLRPAIFVSSTHLENLRAESSKANPADIGDGISADAPLVLKGADGTEYRFMAIGPDNSLHTDKIDIAAHLMLDPSITDQAVATKRNHDAMMALLTQHPELRQNFHGIWVFGEAQGRPPVTTESAMADIH